MKKPNLENAPTIKELIDSKFTRIGANDFYIQLNAQTTLNVRFIFLECEVFLESNKKNKLSLSPTKQIINDVVNLYGEGHQVNLVWNQLMPKCGQVWTQKITQVCEGQKNIGARDVLITKMDDLKNICYFILDDNEYGSSSMKTFLKVSEKKAETLKEYFMKDVAFCDNIKIEEIPISEPVKDRSENPYDYEVLKKAGRIPNTNGSLKHDKNHDSIDALSKLLDICEIINNDHIPKKGKYYCPFFNEDYKKLDYTVSDINDESPIFLNSVEAFKAFKRDCTELFKAFIKSK